MKRINILIKLLFAFIIMSMSLLPWAAANSNEPVQLLQTVADRMIAGLKANKATIQSQPQFVFSLARKIVLPYTDIDETSKRVLPPAVWQQATSAQRAQFKQEFTTLLLHTYASALATYQNQEVKFYPPRGNIDTLSTIEVASDITSPSSPPIHVTYRLIKVSGQWRLYDIAVEGVSLIESFRAQFADILAQGSMNDLLSRLRTHNNQT
jgi:phospholipid transport system substrate-binding protein